MKKTGEFEQIGSPADMTTRRMDVTPALAEKWLTDDKTVHHNRPLSNSLVAKYADDMKNGRWLANHQGIAFGPNHEVLDGQHRLWAIVESGVTISMLVTFNMTTGAQRTVDDHKKRSLVDVMSIEMGEKCIVGLLHVATANRMMHGSQHLQPPSRQHSMAYLTQHFEAIDFAVQSFGGKIVRGITRAPVTAPIARAWYTYDKARILDFSTTVVTGRYADHKKDHAAMLLRDYLLRAALNNRTHHVSPELIYMKSERALYAFLTGQPLAKLHEAPGEMFPIDTDKRVVGAPKIKIAAAVRAARRANETAIAEAEK